MSKIIPPTIADNDLPMVVGWTTAPNDLCWKPTGKEKTGWYGIPQPDGTLGMAYGSQNAFAIPGVKLLDLIFLLVIPSTKQFEARNYVGNGKPDIHYVPVLIDINWEAIEETEVWVSMQDMRPQMEEFYHSSGFDLLEWRVLFSDKWMEKRKKAFKLLIGQLMG